MMRSSTPWPRRVLASVALAVVVTVVPAVGVGAQAPPGSAGVDVALIDTLAECGAGATLLVVVASDLTDPQRIEPLADAIGELGTANRPVELLVVGPGDGFNALAPWEPLTPASATRLAEFLDIAPGPDAEAVPGSLEPAVVFSGASDEISSRADALDNESCSLLIVATGAAVDDVPADAPEATYVATTDPVELAVDLAMVAAAVRGHATTSEQLDVCADELCAAAEHSVELSPTLGRFVTTVVLPSDNARLFVALPRGVVFPLDDRVGGPVDAGSFIIQTTWVTPRVVRLAASVSPADTDWSGAWTFTVVQPVGPDDEAGPGTARLVTAVAPGIEPRFTGTVRLAAGRAVTLDAELVDAEGRLIDRAEVLDAVTMAARVLDATGDEVSTVEMQADENGTWSGRFALPDDVDPDAGRATIELSASPSSSSIDIPDVVTSVQAEVLPGDAWPTVVDTSLTLSGDAGGQAVGSVSIAGGVGIEGCAWTEDSVLEVGSANVAVDLAGGARSAVSCASIPAGDTVDLPIRVDLSEVGSGAYLGVVTLAYGPRDDDAFDTVELELTIQAAVPIDTVRRLQIAVGMALIALVVPLLALWLLDLVQARFRPARRSVVAEAWIAVWSDGSIYRVDTDGSPLMLSDDQFEPAGLRRGRRFEWRGLEFKVRNPTSPFTPPVAIVGSSDAPVVASMGAVVDEDTVVGRLPMQLASTWIFELQPDATREAASDPTLPDFFAAYGRLIVIRPSIDTPVVDLRELPRMAQRLARTVRSARRTEIGTAQEMLDFVEANVSTPRDLPRRHELTEGEVDAEGRRERKPPMLPSGDPYDFSDLDGLFTQDEDVDDEPFSAASDDADDTEEYVTIDEFATDDDDDDEYVADDGFVADDEESGMVTFDAEAEGGDGKGFGIVFEREVNPSAFLGASDPDHAEADPARQLMSDAFGPAPEADAPAEPEAPSDPKLGWARRAKPSWPTVKRKDP